MRDVTMIVAKLFRIRIVDNARNATMTSIVGIILRVGTALPFMQVVEAARKKAHMSGARHFEDLSLAASTQRWHDVHGLHLLPRALQAWHAAQDKAAAKGWSSQGSRGSVLL